MCLIHWRGEWEWFGFIHAQKLPQFLSLEIIFKFWYWAREKKTWFRKRALETLKPAAGREHRYHSWDVTLREKSWESHPYYSLHANCKEWQGTSLFCEFTCGINPSIVPHRGEEIVLISILLIEVEFTYRKIHFCVCIVLWVLINT